MGHPSMFLVVIDLFCLENHASSQTAGLEPQLGKYLVLDAPRAVVFRERRMQGRQVPLVLNLLEHGIADEIGHRLPREPRLSPYDGCVGIVEPHGDSSHGASLRLVRLMRAFRQGPSIPCWHDCPIMRIAMCSIIRTCFRVSHQDADIKSAGKGLPLPRTFLCKFYQLMRGFRRHGTSLRVRRRP